MEGRASAGVGVGVGPLGEQMGWTGVYADPPEREVDPEHPYADPAALMQHRQQKVREKLIRVEKAKVGDFCLAL